MKTATIAILFIISVLTGCKAGKGSNDVWVEGFKAAPAMKIHRGGAGGVIVNGYIYVIGGIDGIDFLNTTERAKINPDGSLGEWEEMEPLNIKRGFFQVVHKDGFLYAIGGGNGQHGQNLLSSVERTKITPDGRLEKWVVEPEVMMSPRRCSKAVIVGNYIYAVGGYNGSFIQYIDKTEINTDGSLSAWTLEENPTNIGRYIHALAKIQNRIYAIGGHHETEGKGLQSIEYAEVTSENILTQWKDVKNILLQSRYGHSIVLSNNYIYTLGGLEAHTYIQSAEVAKVDESGDIGAWAYTTPLGMARESTLVLVNNNIIYIIGGSNQNGFQKSVEWATLSNDGRIGYAISKDTVDTMLKGKDFVKFNEYIIPAKYKDEYFSEGGVLFNMKLYDKSADLYEKVIAIDSDYLDAYQNLSSINIIQKKYDNALSFADKVIAKKDNYAYAYYNRAAIYSLQNKPEDAISNLKMAVKNGYNDFKAIEADPDFSNIKSNPEYNKLIRELILQGE